MRGIDQQCSLLSVPVGRTEVWCCQLACQLIADDGRELAIGQGHLQAEGLDEAAFCTADLALQLCVIALHTSAALLTVSAVLLPSHSWLQAFSSALGCQCQGAGRQHAPKQWGCCCWGHAVTIPCKQTCHLQDPHKIHDLLC